MDDRGNELLRVSGICKDFSTVRVLHDVSFRLRAGEILGIIGENGAGKSTMMKILSGIYSPTFGEIFLDREKTDIQSPLDAKNLSISLIPQEFAVFFALNLFL